MKKRFTIRIFGEVQGVGFRYAVREQAAQLGILGFARNEKDGSVCVEAEGEEERVNAFLRWCRHGPSFARVRRVEAEGAQPLKNFREFLIQ